MNYYIVEENEIEISANLYIRYLQLYYQLDYKNAQIFIYDIIDLLKDEIMANPNGGIKIEQNPNPVYFNFLSVPFKGLIDKIRFIWKINNLSGEIKLLNFEIEFI